MFGTGQEVPEQIGRTRSLVLAACRPPKTESEQKARELFITRIAKVDSAQFAQAIGYSHVSPEFNNSETLPNHQRIGKDRSAPGRFDWNSGVVARSVLSIHDWTRPVGVRKSQKIPLNPS